MLKIYQAGVDCSIYLEDYVGPGKTLTLTAANPIEIGYYKPISDLYLAISTANTNPVTIQVQYYNGSSFVNTNAVDYTLNLTKAGFIRWDRTLIEPKLTTLNGADLFWYKLTVSADTTAINFAGINLLLADDQNLKEEYPNIGEYLPTGISSFVGFHQAARNDILTALRNRGKIVVNNKYKMLDQFDLINIDEVRQASKMLALAKIFYWLSDAVDDKWHQKAKEFDAKYGAAMDLAYLSIDSNDDGKVNNNELAAVQFIEVRRV